MTSEAPIALVFERIAELVAARGQVPLTQFEGPLKVPVDDNWTLWVNGHDTDKTIVNGNGMAKEMSVPSFHAAVFWNGWFAGLVNPYEGTIAAGEAANEDTLIAALETAIRGDE